MNKKVLFATHFNELNVKAAHKAKDIAEANEAELFVIQVVEPLPTYA